MRKELDSGRNSLGGVLALSVRQEIRKHICSHFLPGEEDDLRDDDLLFEGGMIDSAGALSFISFLEERYGFEVQDEELFPENFATVDRACHFVLAKLRRRKDGR